MANPTLYGEDLFSDVTLIIGFDDSYIELKAHKAILANKPRYFCRRLANHHKTFFESIHKHGFAADLVHLFDIDFFNCSFPDAILALCVKDVYHLCKGYKFARDILRKSPFAGRVLLILMKNAY